jgi:hypothetical protein
LLEFPVPDIDLIKAYKYTRSAGDGDFRPMLNGLVSHIGWSELPGLWEDIEKSAHISMAGILQEDLSSDDASEVRHVIETASRETIDTARTLLKRVQADIFGHEEVVRAVAEATGEDGLRAEAIFRDYRTKALSPGYIFVPFIGLLRILHADGEDSIGLRKTLNEAEIPEVNEKLKRILNDPDSLRRIIAGALKP